MKLLTKPVIFISTFFVLMFAAACKKDKDEKVITIAGFDVIDQSGNEMGHYGSADNDWTFNNTLSDREMALFDFTPENVNLNNTVEASISAEGVVAYPNPCTYGQYYHANASDSVLMKIVVVNDKLNVLVKTAVKFKGTQSLIINYSDESQYPNKSSLRVYYSFSAQNKPNYKAGYGDIKICRSTGGTTTLESCFQ
jgi:hypothetical protein